MLGPRQVVSVIKGQVAASFGIQGEPWGWGVTHLAVACTCFLKPLAQAADTVQHQAPNQVVLHGPRARGTGKQMEQVGGACSGRG